MLGAGEVIEDVYDCYPASKAEQTVVASVARINARIGMEIPGEGDGTHFECAEF